MACRCVACSMAPLPGTADRNGRLLVYADQEKNEKRLEAPLSPRTWRLIQLHCEHYRPLLPGAAGSTALFPSLSSHHPHVWPITLGTNITKLVQRRLKVYVTVHLWRHLMGSQLDQKAVRRGDGARLLGHVPGSHNTKRYIRVQTNDAAQRLRRLTDAVRGHGTRQLGYRKHRVRRRKPGGPTGPLGVQ
jgi:hypothetical protein